MRGATSWIAALLVGWAGPACQLLLGGDPVQCTRDEDCPPHDPPLECVDGLCLEGEPIDVTTGDVGTEESTTGPALACEVGTECVPSVPAGWSGPVIAVRTENKPAECPAIAPMQVVTGHAGLTQTDAVCECECDETDRGCDVTLYGSLGACMQGSLQAPLHQDVCASIPSGFLPPTSEALFPAEIDVCTPIESQHVDPARWSEHVRLCATPPVSCDEGLCMPIPDPLTGAATCVWREGEHACEDPGYPSKFVFHREMIDTRGCTPCSCGDPVSCRLTFHVDGACAADPLYETLLDEEQCVPLGEILDGMWLLGVGGLVTPAETSPGSCVMTPGEPTGQATEVGTFTVCCRP